MMTKINFLVVSLAIFLVIFIDDVFGHGMMLDPPNRSSLWRFDEDAPPNYNDNENFCGGRAVQWDKFGGKCGVCGDRYDKPHPQENENTGKYGRGKVVANYTSGSVIETSVLLTKNHRGNFEYSICVLQDSSTWESGEDCFQPITFEDGSKKFEVTRDMKQIKNKIKLPDGLECERCVLRWHYTTGNHWGQCEDGSWEVGCGQQENFRSCADISIL